MLNPNCSISLQSCFSVNPFIALLAINSVMQGSTLLRQLLQSNFQSVILADLSLLHVKSLVTLDL